MIGANSSLLGPEVLCYSVARFAEHLKVFEDKR